MGGALLTLLLLAPSAVIYPTPSDGVALRFSHAKHLAKNIACDFCHEKAPSSRSSADRLNPPEETCLTCHLRKNCADCHLGEPRATEVPRANLKFDHAAHAHKGVACTRCHGDLSRIDLAGPAQLPSMDSCLGCHDSRRARLHASSRCAVCHPGRADGTLETEFASGKLLPSGTLRGDAHSLDFRTQHAAVARDDEKYCANCHHQDFCQGCHNGVVKPLDFHGNDYISRHAVDARRNSPDCNACHRRQSFCLGCHERLGVVDLRSDGATTKFAPIGSRRFHPEGWSDATAAGNPAHHAWQAVRELKQCVSCHRQETCLSCHGSVTGAGAAGKMQVNPHPPNWISSGRCSSLADRNARVCLRCHGATDPHLRCN
jgi:hypothetical protein